MNKFEALTNLANGLIIFTYYAEKELSNSTIQNTKSKKNANRLYIFKKPDTLQKARQFALRFYSQKATHFTIRYFHDFFIVIYIYIQKA